MRRLIGLLIRAYRASFLHPHLSRPLQRMLARVQRGEVTRDLGPFRMRLDRGEFIENRIYNTGEWEPETVRALEQLVRPGDTVIDVGAQVGFITLTLARLVGPAGRVYSLEPSDWAYDRLQHNLSLNQIPHVHADRAGAGAATEAHTIELPRGYRMDGTITGAPQTVDIVSIDDYVARHQIDRLELIKTDTDGMDAEVVKGARGTLERFRPVLLFEVHPDHLERAGETVASLVRPLADLGYSFYEEADLERPTDPLGVEVPPGGSVNLIARA